MIRKIDKSPKVALCRKCGGTGTWRHPNSDGLLIVEQCPQCEGSGRVTVSARMEYDIRPYKDKN